MLPGTSTIMDGILLSSHAGFLSPTAEQSCSPSLSLSPWNKRTCSWQGYLESGSLGCWGSLA